METKFKGNLVDMLKLQKERYEENGQSNIATLAPTIGDSKIMLQVHKGDNPKYKDQPEIYIIFTEVYDEEEHDQLLRIIFACGQVFKNLDYKIWILKQLPKEKHKSIVDSIKQATGAAHDGDGSIIVRFNDGPKST